MKTITTRTEYNTLMARHEEIIANARAVGGFAKLPKEELDEFGEIVAACEVYELEVLKLFPYTGKSGSEIVLQLEEEMFRRRMKQKEMAFFLGISASQFNDIVRGKSPVNLKLAKALHSKLGFDGNVILSSI